MPVPRFPICEPESPEHPPLGCGTAFTGQLGPPGGPLSQCPACTSARWTATFCLSAETQHSTGTPTSPHRPGPLCKERTRSTRLARPPCTADALRAQRELLSGGRPSGSVPCLGSSSQPGCSYRWAVVSGVTVLLQVVFQVPSKLETQASGHSDLPEGRAGCVTFPGYWEVGGHTPGSFLQAVSIVFLKGAAGQQGVAEPSVDRDSHPFPRWPCQPAPPCCKVGPPHCHVDCRLVDRTPGQPWAVMLTWARAREGGHLDWCPCQPGRIPGLSLQSGGSGRLVSRVLASP